MENVRRHIPFFSRGRWGVKNHAPWTTILQHTFHQFHENDLFTPAAAMSYFGLLTLFPALLVILVTGNRFAAGSEALTRIVETYPGSREFLRGTIKSLGEVGWGGIISAVVVIQQLIDQLPVRIVRRSAWLTLVGNAFWQAIFAAAGALVTVALFAVVYRLVPNGRVTLRDTLPSAIVAGLLWEAAKYIFASSLQYFHYDEIYGSVGAVVAVLTWSYVSSLILMFGAQLSVVLHQEHASEEIAAETPASPS